PAHRHHASPQSDGGGSRAAKPSLLGEPRAGGARRGAAAFRGARSTSCALRSGSLVRERVAAVLRPHARDDARPRARGDPASGAGCLDHALRDDGPLSLLARRVPGGGSDAVVPISPPRPAGDDVAARWPALGAEIAPASGAAPTVAHG